MATVWHFGGSKEENVPPLPGSHYWWFSGNRVLLVIMVAEVTNVVKLHWQHYAGLVSTNNPIYKGEVTWTLVEWHNAHLKEFREPVTAAMLQPDEELCNGCQGTYFELLTDLEITSCIWCEPGRPGRRLKQPPAPPPPQRRSHLHPEVPR